MNKTIFQKTDWFFRIYPRVRLHRGQALLGAEKETPDIFWIQRGTVRMYQIGANDRETTLHLFKAPAFFPMMFYLSKRKCEHYFRADNEVEARRAPAGEVAEFLKQNPDVLFDLTSRFADAITGLMLRVEQLSSQNAYQRVCSLLLYLSQKFGKQEKDGCLIELKLSHEDMAAWVGAVRETVSRQIERLTQEGVVASKNQKLVIRDIRRLQVMVKDAS